MDRKALRHLGFTYAGHLEIDQNDKIDATNWTDEAMAKGLRSILLGMLR